ncbi:hypothetical protein JRQ81_009802 [Phrynocephalus forsythii]|uniref:TNFR-Cys domain-containing protein n=1 Tax=Phrynocephalus forsythii TaxID=171643 RepID=A0A9Q0X987_9SAUR|nr:hypothetical protein JRQ81_009802 [Phrynocephalus forsythii]
MCLKMYQIFLATQLLLFREAFSCEDWEYQIKQQCCPSCGAGYRVQEHCTASSGTSCVPCTNRTFMDHPNGLTKCFRCRVCDGGAHLSIKEECTYQKNTVCTCRTGYFCTHHIENSCERCKKHTVAPSGHIVIELGTENSDTKYKPCPPRTFSVANMSLSCDRWTNCSTLGMIEVQAGSATSDAICEHPGPSVSIAIVAAVLFLVLICILFITVIVKKRKCSRKGPAGGKKEEQNQEYLPIPESNPCLVEPMQETTPNLGEPAFTI